MATFEIGQQIKAVGYEFPQGGVVERVEYHENTEDSPFYEWMNESGTINEVVYIRNDRGLFAVDPRLYKKHDA